MKKITILFILSLFFFSPLFSQDIIYLKSGEEKKSTVVEIDEVNIKYKNFDQQDGPIRTVTIKDVFMIIYKNGTKEKFANVVNSSTGAGTPVAEQFKGNIINNLISKEIDRFDLTPKGIYQEFINKIKCNPKSNKVFIYARNSDGREFSFNLFDLETNKLTHIKTKTSFNGSGLLPADFGFSKTDNQCFTLLDQNYLQIFNTNTGEELYHYKGARKFDGLVVSPPGISFDQESNRIKPDNTFLIVLKDNLVCVKKLSSESDYTNFFTSGVPDYSLPMTKDIIVIAYAPFTSLVACNSAASPKKILLCDLSSGKLVINFVEAPVALINTKMEFSKDEKYLIARNGNDIIVWDVKTGNISNQIQVHEKALLDFDISRDNILVTSGFDKTFNFWDINNGFKKIASISPTKFNGKPAWCNHIIFSPDGKKLFAITNSSELIAWNLTIN